MIVCTATQLATLAVADPRAAGCDASCQASCYNGNPLNSPITGQSVITLCGDLHNNRCDYATKAGDTAASIATRFNMSLSDVNCLNAGWTAGTSVRLLSQSLT